MAVVEINIDKLKIHPKNVRTEYKGIDDAFDRQVKELKICEPKFV